MKPLVRATVDAYLAGHHGVISHRRAVSMGMSAKEVDGAVRNGSWHRLHRGVYLVGSHPSDPLAHLAGACLAIGDGCAASHRSAAWLWRLTTRPPDKPELSVTVSRRPRSGITVYNRSDLDVQRVLVHRAIPVTDPLRTLVDLAEVAGRADLDDAVDRALAAKMLTVSALEAEVSRLARRGRRGVGALRTALQRRGLVQAPTASVLESRILRLFRRWGITPEGVEVVVDGGRYRIDVMLVPGLALEVDGYAFHWSPEAKAADSRRRNRLGLQGIRVVEVDWVSVMRHPEQVREEVVEALASAERKRIAVDSRGSAAG